jgi:methionyl-tRNA formyltransferase
MKLIFLGSGAFACPTLRWLAQSDHQVPLVITQPARGAGRGRHTTRTPVAAIAAELGLETLEAENVNDPAIIDRIRSLDARLGLVIAFGQKLRAELLASLPGGFINLHASLLPKYRGAAPINWAIVRGEEKTGCTVFRIVEKMDAGPILASRWTYIKPEEAAGELHDRLAGVGVDTVNAALDLFAEGTTPPGTPQDDTQATLAPKLKKSDGVINWDQHARDVVNHIHGMTPWPGATTQYESTEGRWEKVTITRARVAEDVATLSSAQPSRDVAPGTIDDRRYITTRDAFVELLELKPSSGRLMTWPEYVNGRHVKAGDRFTSGA